MNHLLLEGRETERAELGKVSLGEVARYTITAIRIEGEAIKSEKNTGAVQIGNVDLLLVGIKGAMGVRENRVSPELDSLSAVKSAG